MKSINHLQVSQIDKKIKLLLPAENIVVPPRGWIHAIRTSLNMTLRQLASKLGYIPQAIKGLEESESNETISLKTLKDIAEALDMKLVYGFIPKEKSLKQKIQNTTYEKAQEIVLRTSHTMSLEDQKVSNKRLKDAIEEKAIELQNELPKFLWD